MDDRYSRENLSERKGGLGGRIQVLTADPETFKIPETCEATSPDASFGCPDDVESAVYIEGGGVGFMCGFHTNAFRVDFPDAPIRVIPIAGFRRVLADAAEPDGVR